MTRKVGFRLADDETASTHTRRTAARERSTVTAWTSTSRTCGRRSPTRSATGRRSIHGDEQVSWREYDDRCGTLRAVRCSTRVCSPTPRSRCTSTTASSTSSRSTRAFKIRGVPVNVNYRYTDNELLYLLDNSDAEVLVFHSSLGDRVARVLDRAPKLRAVISVDDATAAPASTCRERCGGSDVLAAHRAGGADRGRADDVYMLYTGGTTGMPKGVMYSARRLPAGDLGVRRCDPRSDAGSRRRRAAARSATSSSIRPCGSPRARRCTAPGCGSARWRRCC